MGEIYEDWYPEDDECDWYDEEALPSDEEAEEEASISEDRYLNYMGWDRNTP